MKPDSYIINENNSIILNFQVKPNSEVQKLVVYPDSIDIYLIEPPKRGKANKELLNILSDILDHDIVYFEIIRGHRSSFKSVRVFNLLEDKVKTRLKKSDLIEFRL